jgi:hypothetical protein
MKRRVLVASALVLAAPIAAAKEPISAEEMARIERLCDAVARSKGMYFVRNGQAHSPDDAAKFLREKLKAMGDEVTTAEEFIDKIATKSSMSGKPYTVRFADGREVPSAEFLRAELARAGRR